MKMEMSLRIPCNPMFLNKPPVINSPMSKALIWGKVYASCNHSGEKKMKYEPKKDWDH